MGTPFPELGTTFVNHLPRDTDPFFSQLPSSFPHYSPMAVPSIGGFEASRIIELLEYIGRNRPQHNLRISPPSTITPASGFVSQSFPTFPSIPGFDSGELQAAVQNHLSPHFPDLSFPGYPPELHPLAAVAPSSNNDPMFGISSSINPCHPDPLGLQLQVAPPLSDLPEPGLVAATATPSSGHLLFTTSPLISPSPLDISPSTNILGLTLPVASPTDDSHSPLNASPSSPPNLPATSSTGGSSHSPLDASSPGPFDPQFDEISRTQSNSPGPGENSDLASGHETSDHGVAVDQATVLECPQGTDTNQQSATRFMKNCGRGIHKCLWAEGGDNACEFEGLAAAVRRHIARVHLELRCVPEYSIVYRIYSECIIGNTYVECVQRVFLANSTSAFT